MVDMWFPIRGEQIPADHGYLAYAAFSAVVPELHAAHWWGLHTVRGVRSGAGDMGLARSARIGIRAPVERLGALLALAGQPLHLGAAPILLGPPSIEPIVPHTALSARVVLIKGFTEPLARDGGG